jgi:transcription antitermination factor NusG
MFAMAYPWLVVRDAGGQELARVLTNPTTRKPLVMPPGAVEALMAQCGTDGLMHPPEPREARRADHVKVEEGPFVGFSGIVQRTTRERVWILLNLFGRQSEVPFTRDQVELIA